MKNPLIGSQYFKDNPSKVLGTESIGGRFGTTLIVDGNPQKAINDIDAKNIEAVEYDLDTLTELSDESIDKVVKEVKRKTKPTAQSRAEKRATRKKKNLTDNVQELIAQAQEEASKNVHSFRDVLESDYNKYISREELEAFLYAHPELPKHKYIDDFDFKLNELVDMGLLFYDRNQRIDDFASGGLYEDVTESAGKFVYKYEYLSGDLGKKLSNLNRGEEEYKQKLGEENFIKQKEALIKAQPQKKAIRDFEDPNRLILRFDSEFCRFFTITQTTKGELATPTTIYDFVRQNSYDDKVIPNSLFHKCTRHEYHQHYILGKSPKAPDNLSKQAQEAYKMGVKSRVDKDGERVVNYIFNNSLTVEDKARISMLWNEKYNSLVSFESVVDSKTVRNEEGEEVIDNVTVLDKIPVAFTFSKSFKDGSRPLELTRTQRNGIAYSMITGSNCIAFDVGVGKTLTSIGLVSQYIDNGKTKFPLFVVPNNVYEKWASEFQGYWDGQKGQYMFGALPHLPKLRMLHNLNKEVLQNNKSYTDEEIDEIAEYEDGLDAKIEIIKGIEEDSNYTKLIDVSRDLTDPMLAQTVELFIGDYEGRKPFKKQIDNGRLDTEAFAVAVCKGITKRLQAIKKNLWYYRGTWNEVPENTITIITYEGLDKLGTEDYQAVTEDAYKVLEQGDTFSADREATAIFEKVKAMLEPVDWKPIIPMEELGIDWICYDEAHIVKKFFTLVKGSPETDENGNIERDGKGVKRQNVSYSLSSGSPSSKALRAFCVNRVIQRQTPQNNVFFLTATPFENNPLEVYSMLALMNQERLDQYGYARIKTFFDNFMKLDYEIKVSATGGIQKAQVLTGFNNLPQFRLIIRSMINYVTGEQANVPRPNKIMLPNEEYGIYTHLQPSELQNDLLSKIQGYIFGSEEDEMTLQDICEGIVEEDLIKATQDTISNVDEMGLEDLVDWLDAKKMEAEAEGEPITGFEDRINKLVKANEVYEEDPTDSNREKRDKVVVAERNKIAKAILSEQKSTNIDEDELSDNDKKAVKIMQGLTWMRMIALSPYLFTCYKEAGIEPTAKEYVETSPKLKYVTDCIKTIRDWHKENGGKEAGQVIYMNAGVNVKGWNQGGFEKITEYLVDVIGYKKEEIVTVKGGMSAKKKELAKEKFLKGEAKILIGSKAIEVGVDLQNNGAVLYNCFFDWNPTNATQVAGRIHRQGNRFNNVRIVYPLVENSADSIIFQYLYEKTMRLKEIWDVDGVKSQLDLKDFDPDKLKLQLITDPFKRANMEIIIAEEKIEEDIIYLSNKRDSISDIPTIVNEYKTVREKIPEVLLMWKTFNEDFKVGFLGKDYVNKIAVEKSNLSDLVMSGDMEAVEKAKESISKLEKKIKALEGDKQSAMDEFKAKLNNPDQFDTDKEYSTWLFTQCGRMIKSTESLGYDAPTDKREERLEFQRFVNNVQWEDEGNYKEQFAFMREEYGWRRQSEQLMNQFRGSHQAYWNGMKTWESLDIDVDAVGESLRRFSEKIDDLQTQKEQLQATIPERVDRIKKEIEDERNSRGTYTELINDFASQNDWLLTEMYPVKVVEPEEIEEKEVEKAQDVMVSSILDIGDTLTLPSGLVVEFFKADNEGYHFYELTKSGRYKKRKGTPIYMTLSLEEVMKLKGEDLEPLQQEVETNIELPIDDARKPEMELGTILRASDVEVNGVEKTLSMVYDRYNNKLTYLIKLDDEVLNTPTDGDLANDIFDAQKRSYELGEVEKTETVKSKKAGYSFSISGSDGELYYAKKVRGKNLYEAYDVNENRIQEGMNSSKADFKDFVEDYISKVDLSEIDDFMQPKIKEEFSKNSNMEVYIDYMDKDNNFKTTRKYFPTYGEAEEWARSEFEKYNPDMISYNPEFEAESEEEATNEEIQELIDGYSELLDILEGEELEEMQDIIEGYKMLLD